MFQPPLRTVACYFQPVVLPSARGTHARPMRQPALASTIDSSPSHTPAPSAPMFPPPGPCMWAAIDRVPTPSPHLIFPLPSPHPSPSDSRLPRRSTLVSTAPPHPRRSLPSSLCSLSSRDLLEKDPSLATLLAIYYHYYHYYCTAPPLQPSLFHHSLPPVVSCCHCHIVTRLPIV